MFWKHHHFINSYYLSSKVLPISSNKLLPRFVTYYYYSLFFTTVCAFTSTTIRRPVSSVSSCLFNSPGSTYYDNTNNSDSSFTMMSPIRSMTNLLQFTTIDENLYSQILARTIPTLSSKSHKGSSGRILILGGSAKYTGAPYYAAMSALRTGSDLVTILCANEATVPLKSYSPELMVEGVYSATEFDNLLQQSNQYDGDKSKNKCDKQDAIIDEKVDDMVRKVTNNFSRMHAIVIGPGLGRCPMVLKATATIIKNAIQQKLNIVLDADGLFLLSLEENRNIFENLSKSDNDGGSKIILTPNVVEYKRLIDSMGNGSEEMLQNRLQGIVIIRKGCEDVIELFHEHDSHNKMICKEEGGLKRSGGIGDILAGSVGTFLAWNRILHSDHGNNKDVVLSSWMACCFTRHSTARAFKKRKRSMTAPDILEEIGAVVDMYTSSTIDST